MFTFLKFHKVIVLLPECTILLLYTVYVYIKVMHIGVNEKILGTCEHLMVLVVVFFLL